ncbi:MAG TPA: hypothetical protein VLH84_00800 [Patescibacteria group bacterium]|nr:hypothetical protein [Patescibacteria group bacterium]
MRRLFIGQPGRHDLATGDLTPEGLLDAQDTAVRLVISGFERLGGIVVTSFVSSASQTADILQDRVGIFFRLADARIGVAGLFPARVDSLWGLAHTVLDDHGVEHWKSDVIVITHPELVGAVAGYEPSRSGVYHVGEDWHNPGFDAEQARLTGFPGPRSE